MNEASPIKGLKLRLACSDLTESRQFYSKVLGLSVLQSWNAPNDKGVLLALPDDRGTIELYPSQTIPAERGLSLQLQTQNIENWPARLAGVAYDGPHSRPWGNIYIFLKDPDGLAIAIFQGQ